MDFAKWQTWTSELVRMTSELMRVTFEVKVTFEVRVTFEGAYLDERAGESDF